MVAARHVRVTPSGGFPSTGLCGKWRRVSAPGARFGRYVARPAPMRRSGFGVASIAPGASDLGRANRDGPTD